MIVRGGGGLGVVLLLLVLLLLVGGGDALPLIFLIAFFALPFLVIRSILRSFSSGRTRSVGGPFFGGMVHTRVLGQPTVPWGGGPPGWDPDPPPPLPRWQAPQQPVLPAVTAADVTSLRDRLGSDVRTLDPGQDPVARQALADASERLSTAGALLERATSDAQLRTAWLATVEGLQAARVVRGRLGLDAGPPIPALPTVGPPLTSHQQVEVGGRTHVGAPSYEPGRPHWFPGGQYGDRYVPGGWYDAPFWPSTLLLGALGGWVAGSVLAGAMYGEDLGLDETGWGGGGLEDGVDAEAGDRGGDGGGGDWGSGGGWGDSGDGGGFGDGFGDGGDWGGFGGGGGWGGGSDGGFDGGFDGGDVGGDW